MSEIIHKGIITRIEDKIAEVLITDNISCEACGAKDACISGGKKDQHFLIEIEKSDYKIGDSVIVSLSQTSALTAVVWAYIFPFVVLMFSIIIFSVFFNELIAAIISFTMLGVYYFLLYILKDYFNKKYRLKLKHNSDE
jgi:sigma-E factor negative regulatory protein RseC